MAGAISKRDSKETRTLGAGTGIPLAPPFPWCLELHISFAEYSEFLSASCRISSARSSRVTQRIESSTQLATGIRLGRPNSGKAASSLRSRSTMNCIAVHMETRIMSMPSSVLTSSLVSGRSACAFIVSKLNFWSRYWIAVKAPSPSRIQSETHRSSHLWVIRPQ